MRRIIFYNLVMVISLVSAASLRHRPQIPILDLHHKQVARSDQRNKQAEASLEDLVDEEEELEEMTYEDETLEETVITTTSSTTASSTKDLLRKRRRPPRKKKVLRKRTTKTQKKPICGVEPLYSLEMSCEQPTTCKAIVGDLADSNAQTTCNTVQVTTIEQITFSLHSVLRDNPSIYKSTDRNERAQRPIRDEMRKVPLKKERRKPRRPLYHKRPRPPPGPYTGVMSSTSTLAPFPGGYRPSYPRTPYENYHCGQVANCKSKDWHRESTTEKKPATSSTTEAMGRTGKELPEDDDYVLSDYQFE